MDKKKIVEQILNQLEALLRALVESAQQAKSAATSEESKAENKYDTRGLEASYLAGAQAERAGQLNRSIDLIRKMELREFNVESAISGSALIETCMDGNQVKWFFYLPLQGGLRIDLDGLFIHTITPESPLGKSLLGKKTGDQVTLKVKDKFHQYEVVSIQ